MIPNLFSWVLFPFLLSPVLPPTTISSTSPQEWHIRTIATSSDVIVQTGTDGNSTTTMIHAPYGVKSEVVSENGTTYATTTPLTKTDVQQMEQQQIDFQKQLNKVFQDQQKMFDDIWAGF